MARSLVPGGKGASHARTQWSHVLKGWFMHHRSSARDSLRRLFANGFSSVMTWLVIGIALAMPGGLSLALDNVRVVGSSLDSPAQLSLFLRPEMSVEAAQRLQNILKQRPDVLSTRLVPRAEALLEFQQLSGFGDVLKHLDENPLPNLIIVSPANARMDAEIAAALQAEMQALPGVDRAVLDMEWVQRLNSLMQLSQRVVTALGVILALGVLLVIGNTIRLAIENRRDEIVIVKLVGGSDAFVRRPFLYTGIWYGLGGAVVSWMIISATLWWLEGPLTALAVLYQSGLRMQGLGLNGGLALLLLGALLGLVGAWLAVSRHLTAIQPK
jgi:cell division transport system permease protein